MHRFRDITTHTVYVTACDLEKSLKELLSLLMLIEDMNFQKSQMADGRDYTFARPCLIKNFSMTPTTRAQQ